MISACWPATPPGLESRGEDNKARDLAQRLHRAWSDSLGEEHPDTLYAANNLARGRFGLGDYGAAASSTRTP